MIPIIAFVDAFLAGSIPVAFLWVRARKGQDIRKLGSGNPGATYDVRCVGFWEGMCVLLLDAAKGAIPVAFLMRRVPDPFGAGAEFFGLLLGVAAILGHAFSPFLGFKGGKGVAVGAGVALAVFPFHFAAAFLTFFTVLLGTRFMSLASLTGAYVFVALLIFTGRPVAVSALALSAALFITWTHRSNLLRIARGEETRFTFNRHKS